MRKETLLNYFETGFRVSARNLCEIGQSDAMVIPQREAIEAVKRLDEPKISEKQAWEVLASRFRMSASELERQVLDGFLAMTAEEIEMESDKIKKLADGIKKLHAENEELKAKPEKVVVTQFVADWIETSKEERRSLYGALDNMPTEVSNWLIDSKREGKSDGQDTFARAWLYGYVIEKEPLYYAKSKVSTLPNWDNNGEDFFATLGDSSDETVFLFDRYNDEGLIKTLAEWNHLGIDDTIAIFEPVEETP